MINRIKIVLKKISLPFALLALIISCEKEIKIDFTEQNIESSTVAEIAINYPKAEGTKDVANLINKTLKNHIISQTNFNKDTLTNASINDAIKQFNNDFNNFKNDFPDSTQKWEIFIDGEVTYHSPEVISIAVNSYLDTGGAHGNTNVRFFNFNSQTGKLLLNKDHINNIKALSKIVEEKLKDELEHHSGNEPIEDLFFGEGFQLPESIGYSDEGIIILYNPYEIASYAQGIIEFTIPFEEINSFLNLN
ncbi:hypothetical protein A9Q86_14120 [Flavobacteriales bacterium 33_180_T64]|nr:hypothetical protein A9Q86_14120 [Flavobacteriales bacterium 33_180_T64]